MEPDEEILKLVREIRADQLRALEIQRRAVVQIRRWRIFALVVMVIGGALVFWGLHYR
jgi:hypothetical protein